MRILKLGFVLAWLAVYAVHGQSKYRVGLCPGTVEGYHTLAKKVATLPLPDKNQDEATRKRNETLLKQNDDRLQTYLREWAKDQKLNRFQVAIYCPDKNVRFWRASEGGKGLFFNESVSAAAGRGDLATDAKPGDNQRCFFQDTTVVLDTLHIRLGDFKPDTHFTLIVNQKKYPLPLNANRTELLLYAGLLPDSPPGRYLPATMLVEDEKRPVTLYFLSPNDRAQLVRSLRDLVADQPPACTDLMALLLSHLTWNWGGKQCVSPALYYSAQRQVIRNLLRTEQISCTP